MLAGTNYKAKQLMYSDMLADQSHLAADQHIILARFGDGGLVQRLQTTFRDLYLIGSAKWGSYSIKPNDFDFITAAPIDEITPLYPCDPCTPGSRGSLRLTNSKINLVSLTEYDYVTWRTAARAMEAISPIDDRTKRVAIFRILLGAVALRNT